MALASYSLDVTHDALTFHQHTKAATIPTYAGDYNTGDIMGYRETWGFNALMTCIIAFGSLYLVYRIVYGIITQTHATIQLEDRVFEPGSLALGIPIPTPMGLEKAVMVGDYKSYLNLYTTDDFTTFIRGFVNEQFHHTSANVISDLHYFKQHTVFEDTDPKYQGMLKDLTLSKITRFSNVWKKVDKYRISQKGIGSETLYTSEMESPIDPFVVSEYLFHRNSGAGAKKYLLARVYAKPSGKKHLVLYEGFSLPNILTL